ncbi:MAG: tetratricopeptide repeat protein [Psychroflexus sp.]
MNLGSSHHEDFDFPIEKFEMMLKTNEILFFDASEFENIIAHYMDSGRLALAKKALKLALDQHPSATNLLLLKAEILSFEDKFDLAISLLQDLKTLEPNNEEIYILIANVYSKQDLHQDAINVLKESLNFADDLLEIHSIMGMEYLFLEDFDSAKNSYINCLENDENDYTALYNIIYCFDFLDQNQEAIVFLKNFLDKNPYCEVAWHQLGKLYFEAKKYQSALEAFDFAIISDDYFIGAYLEKGKVLERLHRYKEAIECYTLTIQIDDPTAFAYLRIGKCFLKLNQPENALKNYKKALHEDPLLDKVWLALTDFHIKIKDYKKALYYINKAINIDEENVLYWKHYAIINLELDNIQDSAFGLKKSLELGNYELDTWLHQIDLLINSEEFEEAFHTLKQAEDFFPNHPELDFRFAGVYFELNNPKMAKQHLDSALENNPEILALILDLFPSFDFDFLK